MSTTQSELRLATLLDERETVTKLHETVVASVQTNEDKLPTESQAQMIRSYREKEIALDEEISNLTEDVERNRRAVESSKAIRRVLAGGHDGVEQNGEEIAYRSMAAYARDVILTRNDNTSAKIAAQFADQAEIQAAKERLQLATRTPANTLSSNVGGLIPPQHIDQIFQVIQTERPIVASAQRASLERGSLTYPVVTTRPVVAVQATQKTEAGNTGMVIDMVTATASTYLGGGDLSWQAVNWSTPNALDMWFRLAASDYALKTETDAASVVSASAFLFNISSTLAATPTFAQLMTAIAAGGGDVYANSGRMADTVYMAPDRYWYALGLTSDSSLSFGQTGALNINGESRNLNVVVSRGLNAGEIIVGDSDGLLVAETPGAPVELRVTEPAIGGYEVGIIGAFEAVVVDAATFEQVEYALRDYGSREVMEVLADRAAAGAFNGGTITSTLSIEPATGPVLSLGPALGFALLEMADATTQVVATFSAGGELDLETTGTAITPLIVAPQTPLDAGKRVASFFAHNAGSEASGFLRGGYFFTKLSAAPADAELAAGELALWFDKTNGAAKLKIKGKSANGTVVQGEVALS
jgi:HK97 family phage major capsid protein